MLYQNFNGYTDNSIKQSSILTVNNDSNKIIKNLLLQGWRNRWTAPQFTMNLKQQLSIVAVSGDNYDLSKLILQQATVSRQPVVLFIEYLQHLLSCGVVSFGAVITNIIETCKKENTQVVICLIDFLLAQEKNINCLSNKDDCLILAVSLARLIKFITVCLEYNLQRYSELHTQNLNRQFSGLNQYEFAIEKCFKLLSIFKKNSLVMSLLVIGLIDEYQNKNLKNFNFVEIYKLLDKVCKTTDNKSFTMSQKIYESFLSNLYKFDPMFNTKNYLNKNFNFGFYQKSLNQKTNDEKDNKKRLLISNDSENKLISLNCVVAFDAILNPKASSNQLAHQLYNIAITNNLKFADICCELIKCSLISFSDSLDLDNYNYSKDDSQYLFLSQFQKKTSSSKQLPNKENVRWASFIYLKIPLVLKNLKQICKEKNHIVLDLKQSLEKLINYTPLLELVDYKSNCDCLANLLNKLVKIKLIEEKTQNYLIKKRDDKIDYFNNLNSKIDKNVFKKSTENLVMIQGSVLTNKAEPTVDSILVSLHTEIANNPENLIQVFFKVITGTSIEIVLNTLTYTGKLNEFIKKIIYFNEINISSTGESSNQAMIRGNLFDVSFLILFYIVQEHGQEIILNCLEEEGIDIETNRIKNSDDMEIDKIEEKSSKNQNTIANSFFVKFCLDYLPKNLTKVNYEDKFLKNTNPNKIDTLLGQFMADKFDYQLIKWNEVILNSVGAFKEILNAYFNNCISFEELGLVLQNMIKRSCSIGLLISFFAINQVTTSSKEYKNKILQILNYITDCNNFAFCFTNQSEVSSYYKEKYTLTLNLIKNLMKELIPKTTFDFNCNNQENEKIFSEVNNVELLKVLKTTFMNTLKKGWLNSNSIYCFDKILYIGGSNWFMHKLIKILLFDCSTEKLMDAVDLIFGLSSLDIEQNCLALLNNVIPQFLINSHYEKTLTEPKLIALSKLLSHVVYTALEPELIIKQNNSPTKKKSMLRRNSSFNTENNLMLYEDDLNKHQIIEESFEENFNENSFFEDSIKNLDKIKKLILVSISKLLRLIASLLNKDKISERSNFSLIMLEQFVYICSNNDQTIKLNNVQNLNSSDEEKFFNVNSLTNDLSKTISNNLNKKIQLILQNLPYDAIANLVKIFPNKLIYDLIILLSNLQTSESRKHAAKALCHLSKSKENQIF